MSKLTVSKLIEKLSELDPDYVIAVRDRKTGMPSQPRIEVIDYHWIESDTMETLVVFSDDGQT